MAADHVAYVQLGHLIAGHVGDGEAGGAQVAEHRLLLGAATGEREPCEHLGTVDAGIAIVELRDAATAQRLAEVQKATRPLRYHRREQRLALAAEIGALGHVP